MKITIYTINDCAFCVQEKDYLKSHNLAFEEKNLEVNREFLTEMLTLSNNFAGTPVTKIEKTDESVVILKGFTKEEFDDVLGFAAPTATAPVVSTITPPIMTPPVVEPVAPAMPVTMPEVVVPPPVMTAPEPVVPAPVAPVAPQVPSVDHASVTAQIAELQALQAKLAAQQAPVAPPVPVVAPVAPVMPQAVVPQPVVAAPVAPAAPQQSVDDSLASILAELQSKINAQQPTPPAQS
ncbi:MAG: glutaredoxin domain-containing protein [bacterium]